MATNINIKQMNWSDYANNKDKPSNSLVYIQDKNFYIQHYKTNPNNPDDFYSQLGLSQYFVIYGEVRVGSIVKGSAGLYVVLKNFNANEGKLYYHDGDKRWIPMATEGGSGGSGGCNCSFEVVDDVLELNDGSGEGDNPEFTGTVEIDQVVGLQTELDVLNSEISELKQKIKTYTYNSTDKILTIK